MDLDLDITQNWKNYRTWLGENVAIVSVNMGVMDDSSERYPNIAYLRCRYVGDENGLPTEDCYDGVFRNLIKTLTQLCALSDVAYAGHILSNHQCQIIFYFDDETAFLDTLAQLDYIEDIKIQQDPNWDTYFEFLMPSSLENKFSLTEEMLESLSYNGIDFSFPQKVEHRFHFSEREDIDLFVEKCNLSKVPYTHIKYTERPIKIEDSESFYLVKLEQELNLNSQEIFTQIEQFENIADEFSAQYIGWEYNDFDGQRKFLN